jgi:hypothetical protein
MMPANGTVPEEMTEYFYEGVSARPAPDVAHRDARGECGAAP